MKALNYAAPLAYVTLTPLATWLTLKAARISLTPSRRLETIAGAPLDYGLTLTTRPRIKATLEFVGNEGLTINPPKLAINGQCTVKVRALYQLGGVRRPRLRVRLIDPRGLVTVERVIMHPPITVIPRLRAAAEYATAMVRRLPHGVLRMWRRLRSTPQGTRLGGFTGRRRLSSGGSWLRCLGRRRTS
jgi:hypothetical protein